MRRFTVIVWAALVGIASLAGCGYIEVEPGGPSDEGLLSLALRQPSPSQAADMAMNPYDPNARYRGTLLLANAPFAGEPVYLELFEDNIDDPDPSVRTASARALALHGQRRHAEMLVKALADPDRLVRVEAARGLQRIHDPGAIPALIAATVEDNEPAPDVRAEACHALGQYTQPLVFEALVAALNDRRLVVVRNAQRALHYLTGRDLGVDGRDWIDWRAQTTNLFAGQVAYQYPIFSRARTWIEYLPFIPRPPNEIPASPVGYEPPAAAGL